MKELALFPVSSFEYDPPSQRDPGLSQSIVVGTDRFRVSKPRGVSATDCHSLLASVAHAFTRAGVTPCKTAFAAGSLEISAVSAVSAVSHNLAAVDAGLLVFLSLLSACQSSIEENVGASCEEFP